MSASSLFKTAFTPIELTDLYNTKIQQKASVGIDRINRKTFESRLKENIEIASRKVLNGSYRFAYFREKLISKGKKAFPRVIAIPTLRDKVVLKALNRVLQETFGPSLALEGIHRLVDQVIKAARSGDWDYVIKVDIQNFYPTINHEILEKKIGSKVRKGEIRSLITHAITQPTLAHPNKKEARATVGVPQGLPISNILANIYLGGLDRKYRGSHEFKYFRFVDDILIVCTAGEKDRIYAQLIKDLKKLELTTNCEKKHLGMISDGFQYLGYVIKGNSATVREQTKDRLVDSIIKSFVQYNYSTRRDLRILEWRLNLRITGCVIDGRRFGWLFYFSQIDDYRLLFKLDFLVVSLAKRYNVDVTKIQIKKFVRTFHEIVQNLSDTKYIPNFDYVDLNGKRYLLSSIFLVPAVNKMSPDEIEQRFRRRIFATIKDLEKDISQTS